MFAIGRAHTIAAWRVSSDAVPVHHPLDPLAADGLTLSTQLGVDTRCPIPTPVVSMNPPDIGQQLAIGDLARTLRPRSPCVEARWRDAEHIAHDPHRPDVPVILGWSAAVSSGRHRPMAQL